MRVLDLRDDVAAAAAAAVESKIPGVYYGDAIAVMVCAHLDLARETRLFNANLVP